ncbi:unnamed protein product, partial [marine sediment metagenome]
KSIDNIVFDFYAKKFSLSQDLKKKLDENYAMYDESL